MTIQETSVQPHPKSLANEVISLIIQECELVHDQQKEPYALVNSGGNRHV
jgi:hypothetical protein